MKAVETEARKTQRLISQSQSYADKACDLLRELTHDSPKLTKAIDQVQNDLLVAETMLRIACGLPIIEKTPELYYYLGEQSNPNSYLLCGYCNGRGGFKTVEHSVYCPQG